MYVYNKLTLMALFLLQFAYLTQTRHIEIRSTAKNVKKNAAACFLSQDFTKRLKELKRYVESEHNDELERVDTRGNISIFHEWQTTAWNPCNASKWVISYLLAETNDTTQFRKDYENVSERTSITTAIDMNVLIHSVESLLAELNYEIESMLENCPLLYDYPKSNISMQSDVEQDQPWRGDDSTDFIAAKFWVVWYKKLHCISGKANLLDARQETETGRQDCSHSICVEL